MKYNYISVLNLTFIIVYLLYVTMELFALTYRYTAHLKNAKNVGQKKGVSAGLGIGLTSFFIFFVHAVGYWFGAYLIQYQDATSGDILTVSLFIVLCMGGSKRILYLTIYHEISSVLYKKYSTVINKYSMVI